MFEDFYEISQLSQFQALLLHVKLLLECLSITAASTKPQDNIGEGLKILRFVVVPTIQTETGSMRNGARFYCQTVPQGFNIYGREEKLRLKTTYESREGTETECRRLNFDRLQIILSERESIIAL
ncbi:hypothetical protein EMIT0194MI4_20296 [Pseudomonas sp. IT-194MI4]|nr:hypothetical protein FFH90_015770 [Pseudomonas sp. ATCC 43928]